MCPICLKMRSQRNDDGENMTKGISVTRMTRILFQLLNIRRQFDFEGKGCADCGVLVKQIPNKYQFWSTAKNSIISLFQTRTFGLIFLDYHFGALENLFRSCELLLKYISPKMSKVRRLYDFCNAKYQGETKSNLPEGFGLLLDHNFTFVASQWTSGKINHPTLAVFNDSTIIYGDITNRGLLAFSNPGCTIYLKDNRIAVDCQYSDSILSLQDQDLTGQKRLGNQKTRKMQIVEQRSYSSNEQKFNLIEEILGIKVPIYYHDYQAFIRQSYRGMQLQIPSKSKTINKAATGKRAQFVHPKSIFTIAYKKQSIYIKILEKVHRVSDVGYSNDVGKGQSEISRKFNYDGNDQSWTMKQEIQNINLIHELEGASGIKSQNRNTSHDLIKLGLGSTQLIQQRAQNDRQSQEQKLRTNTIKQMNRSIHNYFKSSLSFVNRYIDLKELYQWHGKNLEYILIIQDAQKGKYGQRKIQLGKSLQEMSKSNLDLTVNLKEASEDDLKNQLNRVKNRGSKSPIKKQTSRSSPKHKTQLMSNQTLLQESHLTKLSRDKSYFERDGKSNLEKDLITKSINLTPVRNQQFSKHSGLASRYQQSQNYSQKENNFEMQRKTESMLSDKKQKRPKELRYSYLDDTNRHSYSPGKSERRPNLYSLLGSYENISRQIQKQTPKNVLKKGGIQLSPQRFSYLKDVETPKYGNLSNSKSKTSHYLLGKK